MTWPFLFAPYEETMVERPEYGNNIMAAQTRENIVLYVLCRSNVAYFAHAFQPFFLKNNNFKVGKTWEMRTSFVAAMYASDWGKKDGQESILAITICRAGFEEILKACLKTPPPINSRSVKLLNEDPRPDAEFFWEPGRDLFGEVAASCDLRLLIRNELLNHMSRHWIRKVFHMTIYMKAAQRLMKEHHPDLVMVPDEKLYLLDPNLGRALHVDPSGFEDYDAQPARMRNNNSSYIDQGTIDLSEEFEESEEEESYEEESGDGEK